MPPLGGADFKQVLLGGLLPLGLLALIALALWRFRATLVLLALAAVCAVVAEYSYASRDACTYCAERNLLPLAPIGLALVAVGIYALMTLGSRLYTWIGVGAIVVIAAAVGQRARVELRRFTNSSYFLETSTRKALAKLPSGASVQLEGFDASLLAQAEEGYTYVLANERAPGRVSVVTATNPFNGLAYLTFNNAHVPAVTFSPGYDYVLTRVPGIQTGRRVVARDGPIALEARARPFDVLPIDGLAVPVTRLDPSGIAWVQPPTPLTLLVTGRSGPAQVQVALEFRTREPVTVSSQVGVRARQRGDKLSVCVRATGRAPIWTATVTLQAAYFPTPVPAGEFPPAVPQEGIALTAMHAATGACSP
jgi:hypothetical protein